MLTLLAHYIIAIWPLFESYVFTSFIFGSTLRALFVGYTFFKPLLYTVVPNGSRCIIIVMVKIEATIRANSFDPAILWIFVSFRRLPTYGAGENKGVSHCRSSLRGDVCAAHERVGLLA